MILEKIGSISQAHKPECSYQGELRVGDKIYTIKPILKEDRNDVVHFLLSQSNRFLINVETIELCRKMCLIDAVVQRHLNGDPWSAYLICNSEKEIAGVWAVEPDDKIGDLFLSIILREPDATIKMLDEIGNWTRDKLLLEASEKGVRVPVFENGKKIGEKPLEEAFLRTVVPSVEPEVNEFLLKRGFKLIQELECELFNLYEIAAKDLLNEARRLRAQAAL